MADNHNNDNLIDLEKLKKDPNLWSRLSVLKGDDDKMEHIFEGEENPFLKDGPAAMEKINRLAEQGKLFVRGYGRASHYQKIEKKGDELKMEEGQYVLKRGAGWDPVGSLLSYLSSSYFRWLGIGFVAKWIDKRRKNRGIEADEKNRERDKYKELSRKEKKELKKALKKEKELEKARKKLEKLEQETQNARKELDQLQGKDTGKNLGEMKSPLSQPPVTEQDKTSMQPTALGDQPPNSQNQLENQKEKNFVQAKAAEYQFQGTQKTEKAQEKSQPQTKETARQESYQIAQEMTIEYAGRPPVVGEQKPEAQPKPEETVVAVENEEAPAKRQDSEPPREDMDSPVNNPPDLEKDKVSAQERSKDQADLYDRLTAEKQAMDEANNWQGRLLNSMFSRDENKDIKQNYDAYKDKEYADEFLTGMMCGILSQNYKKQKDPQVAEDMVSGKPLSEQNADLVRDGFSAYSDAITRQASGNSERMAEMVANTFRELSRMASQETSLSPRLVTIGRMLTGAAKFATDNELALPLSETEMSLAKGTATMADIALKYHNARQTLGNGPLDISSEAGRQAVNDLLMGSSVDMMIKEDKRMGQGYTNTQKLMGVEIWSMDKLSGFTKDSPARRSLNEEQVQELLQKPNSLKSMGIVKGVVSDILQASVEDQKEAERSYQKELAAGREKEPEINPLQARV